MVHFGEFLKTWSLWPILIGQKLFENAKIEILKCDNLADFKHCDKSQQFWESVKKCQILICIFGRNPNRPYDVHQLFGNGHQHLSGNTPSFGDKVPRTWESYGIESQKYLRIGNTELNFSGYVEPVSISHICSISDSMSRSQLSMKKRRTVTPKSLHSVWKSPKKSHSTLRAKRATVAFWVDKS